MAGTDTGSTTLPLAGAASAEPGEEWAGEEGEGMEVAGEEVAGDGGTCSWGGR